MNTITSKSDEIAGLHRTLEKTREQLHKALEAVVDLSARNSELRAAIRKAAVKYDAIRWGYDGDGGMADVISEMEEALLETQTGEGK